MAPGRKKRGYWLEILLVSILLFLLLGSRSQVTRSTTGARTDLKATLQRSFMAAPATLK